ncbi:MAG: serine/threonine-protein kinase [Sporichthyaceae bacterium]
MDLALPGYRMQRLVAASNRFEVYQAWSEERSCFVVVKTYKASMGAEGGEKILREGNYLTGLNHPHLIKLYEVCELPQPAIVLEVLTGPTLRELFREEGRLPAHEVAVMGRQIAAALWYLHGRGILHCDLKPANLIAERSIVKVIDLSGARGAGVGAKRHGTQGYLSPEQANREYVSDKTDVWGLGVVLLEALADRDPFPPKCPEYKEDHGPLASPPGKWRPRKLPEDLGDIVDACCAFDPAARPTLAQVIEVLDRHVPPEPAP